MSLSTISEISWLSGLLVNETGVPGENYRHWQYLSNNVKSSTPRHEWDSNSQLYWWYALIAQVVVNSTTIRSQRPLLKCSYMNHGFNLCKSTHACRCYLHSSTDCSYRIYNLKTDITWYLTLRCCRWLWIVHSWLFIRISRTFSYIRFI